MLKMCLIINGYALIGQLISINQTNVCKYLQDDNNVTLLQSSADQAHVVMHQTVICFFKEKPAVDDINFRF